MTAMMKRILPLLCLFALLSACAHAPDKAAFLNALEHDAREEVTDQLDRGIQVDQALNARADTALHLAVEYGHLELANLLLEHGANPFQRNRDNDTPIDLALAAETSPGGASWSAWSADIAKRGEAAYQRATEALRTADIDALKRLLSSDTFYWYPIPTKNRFIKQTGPDPLTITAVRSDCLICLKALLEAGYDPDRTNSEKQSALNIAARRKNTEMAHILIEAGADTNIKDRSGWTALMVAVSTANVELVDSLLKAGADPDARLTDMINSRSTPLHLSATGPGEGTDSDKARIADMLIRAGADIDALNSTLDTPLHIAVLDPALPKLTDTLLRHGASVDLLNEKGYTPLMLAVISGRPDRVRRLLDAGADVHLTTPQGWTALHVTAGSYYGGSEEDRVRQAELLIEQGADVNARSLKLATPLVIAAGSGLARLTETFLKHGADPNLPEAARWTPLMYAVKAGDRESVKLLLKAGADVNARGLIGWSALHVSANKYSHGGDAVQADISRMLIDAGAQVNAENNQKVTPLHFAAIYNRPKVGQILLAHGADRKARTIFGQTPAHLARTTKHQAFLDLLESSSAEPASSASP
ncbi:MAG: hypothetical protein D6758_11095 [Gammaproteobacteria bacterium]|nr:MAG: hypothetical protein D6758_11095 [Gammaproteobacteria bacterium]